jgi:hypothetical protein
MQVRRAMGKDCEGVLDLVRDMYRRSRYSGLTLDEKFVKQMLLQIAMANAARAADGAIQCYVADADGDLVGFIIPVCDRFYHVGVELMVSDMFFYVREGAPARAAAALWRQLETWARAPGVVAVWPGANDAIDGDIERTAKFFTRRGYRRRGITFEKLTAASAARSVAA